MSQKKELKTCKIEQKNKKKLYGLIKIRKKIKTPE